MRTTLDSPVWNDAERFSATSGNLTFNLFYDSFNPFHNKIAGKVVSCGVFSLRCLNLPYDISRKPENTCFFALTPLPYSSDVVTISTLSSPLVDQLLPYNDGKVIGTYRHPLGRLIRLRIKPTIHDILAGRKLMGFGSHACEQFCANCLCTVAEVERLDHDVWTSRNATAVRTAAAAWEVAPTLSRRDELFKLSGVRGSPLHRLEYRDPVKHIVLGVMHNWLEGVLQHHWRVKFAVGAQLPGENVEDERPDRATATDRMDLDETDEDLRKRERAAVDSLEL